MSTSTAVKSFVDVVHDDAGLRYHFAKDPENCLSQSAFTSEEKKLLAARDQDLWHASQLNRQPIMNVCVCAVVVLVVERD